MTSILFLTIQVLIFVLNLKLLVESDLFLIFS